MITETDQSDEWWTDIPSAPFLHSRLYHLEPIGMGSSAVESLTSYVIRLAEAHSLPTRVLVSYEIAPHLKHSYLSRTIDHLGRVNTQTLTAFWRQTQPINGLTSWTEDWVQALEYLTNRKDLRFLTMLTWKNVFSPLGLLRRTQAWCPVCYDEWREAKKILYQPLLWALQSIRSCSQHEIPLQEVCPYEKCRYALPFLSAQIQVGYCPKCHRWLGGPSQRDYSALSSHEENALWQERQIKLEIGELLAKAPSLITLPQQEVFALTMAAYVREMSHGNRAECAQRSHVSRKMIKGWIENQKLPRHEGFVRMCVSLGISPLNWLTGKTLDMLPSKELVVRRIRPAARKAQKKEKKVTVECARSAMEAALHSSDGFIPPPAQIAESLGCSLGFLMQRFPKLYQDLVEARRHEKRKRRDESLPELQIALEAALRLEDPGLSLKQVAKNVHKQKKFLIKNFPELCQAISTKYLNAMKKQRIEREQKLCEEVRQATLLVHAQGMYPSHRKIRALLKSEASLKSPLAYASWRATLQELGWDREHFPRPGYG